MRRSTTAAWLAALTIAGFCGVPAARAEDDDAAALLRRARVAESVEQDPAKAIDLYRKAVDTGGATDAARDAAMRLAELLETRGDAEGALAMLAIATERFGARLDDAAKRRVHDAMARLLPPNARGRSPLGEVRGRPAAPPSAVVPTSPLDAKILGLLARLDDAQPDQRNAVEQQVRAALDVVGKDALPTLERTMNTDRLDKAQFAAREYARIGQAEAVPGLERTIREGDGFARGAAIDALARLSGPEATAAAVAAIDRLLALPALGDRRRALLLHAARFLDDEALLRRHAAGGPDAGTYLLTAVQRSAPAAIERALAILRQPGTVTPDLLPALVALVTASNVGWNGQRLVATVPNRAVEPARRLDVLRLLATQPITETTARSAAGIAAAVTETAGEPLASEAAHAAWTYALSSPSLRQNATRTLLEFGVGPPVALFETEGTASAFWANAPALWRSAQGWAGSGTLFRAELATSESFWRTLLSALPSLGADDRSLVLLGLGSGKAVVVPESTGPRWMDVLLLPLGADGGPSFAYQAAAKSGDPRFGALVRERVLSRPAGFDKVVDRLLSAVDDYTGPDRLDLALDLLRDEEVARRSDFLGAVLAAGKDAPEFWPTVARALTVLPEASRYRVASALSDVVRTALPPKEHDALWPPVLAAMTSPIDGRTQWVARLAARAGDPAVLERLRRSLNGGAVPQAFPLFHVLPDYAGPGRLEFLLEALAHPNLRPFAEPLKVVEDVLEAEFALPATRDRLVALARDPQAAASPAAIQRLVALRDRALLVELMTAQERAASPGSAPHRRALIEAATRMHLREAIPFLLREFQEGLSSEAAKAMDEIREYHERLASFQDWSKGGGAGRRDVAALLEDADSEIRRAAVLSLAAMGDREALPSLLRVAKADKDPRVRQAALEAIERMAKSPPPAPPAPAPAMTGD